MILKNDVISIELIPELGGKIISMFHIASGKECLFQKEVFQTNDTPSIHSSFEPYAYGFDECFPSVSACEIQIDEKAIQIADHGNLWITECEVVEKENHILLTYKNPELQTVFKKEICLNGEDVLFNYSLENLNDDDLPYIWSSHPLLSVEKGDTLQLGKIKTLSRYWASEEMPETLLFPEMKQAENFSIIDDCNIAIKSFSEWDGSDVSICFQKSKLKLAIQAENVPYLGLWQCYGGWPTSNSGMLTVALEPTNAGTDNLNNNHTCKIANVCGNSSVSWSMTFSFSIFN